LSFSNYLEALLLNATLRTTPVYLALYTSDPGEGNTGTEVAGNGYERQLASFAAPASGVCLNDALVTFGPSETGGWGTVTHFAIFDAETAGNLLYYGALDASKTVVLGDGFAFAVGSVSVTLN
jgi:hypothetical protein